MKAVILVLSLVAAPVVAADGTAVYRRCAACHLATGMGVPSAYPPFQIDFKQLASNPRGRRYLALVVMKGLAGPLTVDGKQFRGVMPAQILNDEEIAAALNYIGQNIAKAGQAFRPFTASEVAAAREYGRAMNASDVARLRKEVR